MKKLYIPTKNENTNRKQPIMKTIIINLILILSFLSCSSDEQYNERNPKYIISVDFKTGTVIESGTKLLPADKETLELCLKIKEGQSLPEGLSSKVLCMGGNENGTHFNYLQIIRPSGYNYYLMTFHDSKTLVHYTPSYEQSNCLKRWILTL